MSKKYIKNMQMFMHIYNPDSTCNITKITFNRAKYLMDIDVTLCNNFAFLARI